MKKNIGIILMNLGSPNSPSVKDVRKYLAEFLMDEKVIDVPYFLRLLLVRGIIVPFRSPKSAHAYQSIWTDKGSPLIVLTNELKNELEKNIAYPIEIAMRYAYPNPQIAFDNLLKKNPQLEHVLLIPLYPHYAMSSYETAVEYAKEIYHKKKYTFKLNILPAYYNDALYIDALKQSIAPYLKNDFDLVLFSYHGVPKRHILKGDITKKHCFKCDDCCNVDSTAHPYCYRHQCFTTTRLVSNALQLSTDKYMVSFQSRLGKDEWLMPYTAKMLEELPKKNIKKILVVCPAFISDCLETLEEIAVEGKNIFMQNGGEQFTMIPCLNTHPQWIKTLTQWVKDYEK